ncbi:MAG: RNA-binding domain-containing protein [Negativicutes bacterium]|jgi:ATP-dependent DNA helicase RecG
MNYAEIIKQGESKTVEFKEILPEGEKIAKSVIAFANTGGGRIFIGVRDDGTITGIDETQLFVLKDKVANIIHDSISPNVFPEIYSLNLDDKMLMVIQVAPSNSRPHYLRSVGIEKSAYVRLGSTNKAADKQMRRMLELQQQNITFDEEICVLEPADSERCAKLKALLKKYTNRSKALTDMDLHNLRLISEMYDKTYFTNGAAIILGLLPNASIKCARFAGTERLTFLDRKDCEGDLFSQIEQAEKFLAFNLRLGARIEGFRRIDIPEIPFAALREALVNAVIHRDYSLLGADVRVTVNDVAVEITSPGDVPGGSTIGEALQGRSEIRNNVLARVLKETEFFDRWGTGLRRIMSECAEAGLPAPEIIERGYGVSVKFLRPDLEQSERKVDANRTQTGRKPDAKPAENISEFSHRVLAYIGDAGSITRAQAESLLNLGRSRTAELLASMVDAGTIEQIGSNRSTRYIIKQK